MTLCENNQPLGVSDVMCTLEVVVLASGTLHELLATDVIERSATT